MLFYIPTWSAKRIIERFFVFLLCISNKYFLGEIWNLLKNKSNKRKHSLKLIKSHDLVKLKLWHFMYENMYE